MVPLLSRSSSKALGLLVAALLALVAFALSVALGTTKIGVLATVESFLRYDPSSTDHMIIRTTRLPRAAYATLVGGSLAVSGALMQALTRNPLASPGIFGINAGAVAFVVLALTFLPVSSIGQLVWFAFLGAAVASLTVYALGSMGRGGLTPMKVVLAGSAMTALFTSITQGMLALDESGLQSVLFWLAGSIAGKELDGLYPVLPYMLGAGIAAMVMARSANLIAAGDEVAVGLGQRIALAKAAISIAVVLLAGSSVAVAGAVGFVGLVIPHLARYVAGVDYRWVIPYSAVLGATLLLLADIAARFLVMPGEIPLGVMTGLVGGPFFIYAARRVFLGKGEAP